MKIKKIYSEHSNMFALSNMFVGRKCSTAEHSEHALPHERPDGYNDIRRTNERTKQQQKHFYERAAGRSLTAVVRRLVDNEETFFYLRITNNRTRIADLEPIYRR